MRPRRYAIASSFFGLERLSLKIRLRRWRLGLDDVWSLNVGSRVLQPYETTSVKNSGFCMLKLSISESGFTWQRIRIPKMSYGRPVASALSKAFGHAHPIWLR